MRPGRVRAELRDRRRPVSEVPDKQLIEAKVQPSVTDAEAGLFCHLQDGSGYAFLIRGTGDVRIARIGSGKLETLATGTATDLRRDDTNRVQAACVPDGGTMKLGLWVNGDAVATADPSDDAESPGTSGLIVARAGAPASRPKATFDNFSLCSV